MELMTDWHQAAAEQMEVELSEYGDEAEEFVENLNELWEELIAQASPSKTQKQKWLVRLQSWQTILTEYSQEDCLSGALTALEN